MFHPGARPAIRNSFTHTGSQKGKPGVRARLPALNRLVDKRPCFVIFTVIRNRIDLFRDTIEVITTVNFMPRLLRQFTGILCTTLLAAGTVTPMFAADQPTQARDQSAISVPPAPSPDPLGTPPAPPTKPAQSKETLKPLAPKVAPTAAPPDGTPNGASPPAGGNPPAKPPAAAANQPTKPAAMPPAAPAIKDFNAISDLEKVMFGVAQPTIPLEYRLDRLESEVFHQTNPDWTAQQRIARLQKTLLGTGNGAAPPATAGDDGAYTRGWPSPDPAGAPSANAAGNPWLPPLPTVPDMQLNGPPPNAEAQSILPMPGNLTSPEFQKEMPREQLEQFALQVINDARYKQGLSELKWDDVAYKVSKDLIGDLCKRNTVAHVNTNGANPDVRYTKAGGTDCLVESVVGIKLKGRPKPNKELVYDILKELTGHQDDRDAMLSRFATNFAFTFDISANSDKIIACAETVTEQAHVKPIPAEAEVGDKVDIAGVLTGPYHFAKITVAWEGLPPPDDSEEQDEAAPYFPPLDYEAYARRSEHDFQKAARIATLAGIGLALAGGVFMPPVALAAPLIAASTSTVKPKAISEIPVRGGVKVDGQTFAYKAPLSKDNKEGIYYVTVWAQSEVDQMPFAVSRRAIIVHAAPAQTQGKHATEIVDAHAKKESK
jgi:uncharacterized protein YkwD